ncbi:MAG TPA: sigma-54 dependent transcriptional regulator [Phycisphaeraceae bacterium]
MPPIKHTILVSSGYQPSTLAALRKHWSVVDIADPEEALAYLRQCGELPMAVAIGYALLPTKLVDDAKSSSAAEALGNTMPAHVMLGHLLSLDPDLPVIISTKQRHPAAVVDLIKRGAFGYVAEPPDKADPDSWERYTQEFILVLRNAVQWRQTLLENRRLKQEIADPTGVRTPLLARSPAMLRVMEWIQKVAPTPATVLITGESGTGKELAARAIHDLSPQRDQPFLAINCGALSDSLLTSELFGHVKGAFTGAEQDQPGLIRQAGEGTLLLDELGAVSPAFQVMLLRVLEQRVARPVGGQREYPVRCRFLAAANRDLAQLARQGRFREDLLYRLNVFHIHLPPLRDRREDIPILAHHFLAQLTAAYAKPITGFDPAAMEQLERHPWPGNVRQLRNTIERAVILCEGPHIQPRDLAAVTAEADDPDLAADADDYHAQMRRFETRLLRQALARCEGNLSRTARLLRMKRTTLHYRVKQLGLSTD